MSLAKRSQSSLSRHSPPTRCCPECSKMPPILFLLQAERSPHLYFLEARSCLEVSLARIVLKSNQQQQQLSERSEKEKAQHRPQQSTHQIDNRDRQGRL